jgi:hypothetical protein
MFSSTGAVIDTTQQDPTPAISPEGGKGSSFQNAVFLFGFEIINEAHTVSNSNKVHEKKIVRISYKWLYFYFRKKKRFLGRSFYLC